MISTALGNVVRAARIWAAVSRWSDGEEAMAAGVGRRWHPNRQTVAGSESQSPEFFVL
jgi:hypothetical protein